MSEGPNVLVVLCDQLRRSALSYAGDPNVETPTIDNLAADGARFTAACSTYPVCVPTRATFMSGESAHALNAYGHDFRLSPRERTLGDAFQDSGYWTGYVGKWHLHGASAGGLYSMRWAGRMPIPEGYQGGFEHWRGFDHRNDPYDTYYFADDDPQPRPIDGHQTDGLTDIGIDLLGNAVTDDRPFFLCLSFEAPHPPHIAPPEYYERWREIELDLPSDVAAAVERGEPPGPVWGPDGAGPYTSIGRLSGSDTLGETVPEYHRDVFLDDVRGYYAMIEHLDANVGRLLDCLDDHGIREETVVVFTSDHGEQLGRHGTMKKQLPYEASIGVPFVVSHPGRIDGGTTHADPIHTEDWYPTLLGLAGIGSDPALPGTDCTPLLTGAEDGLNRPGVPIEHVEDKNENTPWRGFRTERYKYTVRDGEPWQLFDLAADPLELNNRLGDPDYRETADRLHGLLRSHLAESVDTYPLEPAYEYDGLHQFDRDAGRDTG